MCESVLCCDHKLMSQEDCRDVFAKLLSSQWHVDEPETTLQYHGARDCQSLKLSYLIMRHYSGVHVSSVRLAEELRVPLINHIVCFKTVHELPCIYRILDNDISDTLRIRMPMSHADMDMCRNFVFDAMWVFPLSATWRLKTDGRYEMQKEARCWMQVVGDLENGVYRSKEDFLRGVCAMAEAHLEIHAEGSMAHAYASHLADLCGLSRMYRTMMEWRLCDWEACYIAEEDGVSFTERFYLDYPEVEVEWYRTKRRDAVRFMSVHYRASLMKGLDGHNMAPSSGVAYKRVKYSRFHN